MLKKSFALAVVAFATVAPAQALTLTQWNFNSVSADASPSTGTLIAAIGAGTASLVGGTTGSFSSGDANGGSTDPVTAPSNATNDSGWQTTGYAAQGTGNKSRGVQFLVDTTGFDSIKVSWDQRLSNSASRYTQFQYTTDGTTFVDASAGSFLGAAGDTWYNNRSVDLTGVSGVANNANFGFRIVAAFAPSSSGYVAATMGSSYGTAGTNRFDMVTVSAVTAVPEPESYALMLAGLGAIGLLVARRRA